MGAKISVVIPLFNGVRYIGETLDSVTAQTRAPDEIIVVDDGSEDDGPALAEARPEASLVRCPHRGVGPTLNEGVARARGEFVAFLDADDRLLPETLEAEAELLERRPEAALVYGQARYIDAEGYSIPGLFPAREYPPAEQFGRLLERNFILTPSGVLARRWALEEAGPFDPEISHALEYDLWLRIARRRPLACLERPVVEYRRRLGAMTGDVGGHRRGETAAVQKYSASEILAALEAVYPERDEARLRLAAIELKCGKTGAARELAAPFLTRKDAGLNLRLLARFTLGQCAWREGLEDEALAYFEVCLAYAPESPEVLNNLAVLHARQSADWETATVFFERAAKNKPGYGDAAWNCAQARRREKRALRWTGCFLRDVLVPQPPE